MKNWKSVVAIVVLALLVGFCVYSTSKQSAVNKQQSLLIAELVENDKAVSNSLDDQMDHVKGLLKQAQSVREVLSQRIAVLEAKKEEVVEAVDNSEELTSLNDRIEAVLSQIDKLEKNKVTEDDLNKWVQKLELLVNQSLVELSKPPTVPPVKPMPNITPVVKNTVLSNAEKAALVKKTKGEIFKDFESAGYGKFVDGKFELRKGFFGAEILSGDEWKYGPVESLK